ncbi:hypothetical protein [Nitrososphaera sp. AFS]|uniref:hypothetical protein n=1 Tax=Nitrososphaera sp. AFS TaxID=2301191 RepID=UPI0013922EC3|nr:hypothetical protein [Nitrososphaera sp. AFS]
MTQKREVLNDLDEKFHNMTMAMLVMEDPYLVCVIESRDYTKQKEVAFSFYILWICAHFCFQAADMTDPV